MPGTPYRERYDLLCAVVGAWSRRHSTLIRTPAMLPLQVIRQYPIRQVDVMFREVVEGVEWKSRRFPGFGIPATSCFHMVL